MGTPARREVSMTNQVAPRGSQTLSSCTGWMRGMIVSQDRDAEVNDIPQCAWLILRTIISD